MLVFKLQERTPAQFMLEGSRSLKRRLKYLLGSPQMQTIITTTTIIIITAMPIIMPTDTLSPNHILPQKTDHGPMIRMPDPQDDIARLPIRCC